MRVHPLLVFVVAFVVLLPTILRRDLWAPDEPRHAEVARTMLVTHEYLVPHLNGAVYPDKPAPPFWAMAFAMKKLGVHDAVARLPTLLAAAGTIALVVAIAQCLGLGAVGLLAALALATAGRYAFLAERVSLDVQMTFFVVLALWAWLRQWRSTDAGFAAPALNGAVFFLATAGAVAMKGPLGLFVTLVTALVHGLATRRARRFLAPAFLATGLVVFVAATAAWLIPTCRAGGEAYTRELVFQQSVGRIAHAWNHEQPFWYYLTRLPTEFLPWTFLLGFAVVLLVRRGIRAFPAERDTTLFLLAWIVPAFLLLSATQSKRGQYLLPLYPALALLSAAAVRDVARLTPGFARAASWVARATAGILVLAALALFAAPFIPRVAELGVHPPLVPCVLAALILLAGTICAWRVAADAPRALVRAGVSLFLATPVLGYFLLPAVDAAKSARPIAEALLAHATDADQYVPLLDVRPEELCFYSGLRCREVESREDFLAALARPDVTLAAANKKELKKLGERLPAGVDVVAEHQASEDVIQVLRVRHPQGR